jgi:hypothetical protein
MDIAIVPVHSTFCKFYATIKSKAYESTILA